MMNDRVEVRGRVPTGRISSCFIPACDAPGLVFYLGSYALGSVAAELVG